MRRLVAVGAALVAIGTVGVADAAPVALDPSPFTLYPRRAGAQFEDVEARPGQSVGLDSMVSLVGQVTAYLDLTHYQVVPAASVPSGLVAPDVAVLQQVGDVDGFAPHPVLTGDALRFTVGITYPSLFAGADGLSGAWCTVTAGPDGAQFVASRVPPPPRATLTTSTTLPTVTTTAELYVTIGARRGRFYVRCGLDGAFTAAVWGIDVS